MINKSSRLRASITLATPLLALVTLAFSACTHYSVVSERNPIYTPHAGSPPVCEECIASGTRKAKSDANAALGEYLSAADAAAQQLQREPNNVGAREAYNYALARAFSAIKKANLQPWTRPLHVHGRNGAYLLSTKPPRNKAWSPELYTFTPADQFEIGGSYVNERVTKPGLGAPLVAVGREIRKDARANFLPDRTYYGVTAIARFEPGRRCVIAFEDPLETETTTLAGHSFPLATDFTVPLAVMLAQEDPKKRELSRLLKPEQYAETARISRLEPYRPDKIPVLVVHGLMDSPATWAPMINKLRGDPAIRQKYQFWYYSYPSGYPYPYSAAIMRRELDAIQKHYGVRQPLVLIGHSMGGMISRLMITDSGDKLWLAAFGKSPANTRLSAETRATLEESLIFRHRPDVSRVIFIAAPHRGSDLASHWLGRFGATLVKTPRTLFRIATDMRSALVADSAALRLNRAPNSIDTLAPNNRFVKTVNTIPITPGIPYHSIIGDRGRGDSPKSSDGFVPYWSSHLEGAESELIVPSNHSAHQSPQAVAEVRRILLLHLKHPKARSAQKSAPLAAAH